MTRTIHKYPMSIHGINAPLGPVRLVACQGGDLPTLWIEHAPDAPSNTEYEIVGTGQQFDDTWGENVSSAVCGPFVWHVYRRPA